MSARQAVPPPKARKGRRLRAFTPSTDALAAYDELQHSVAEARVRGEEVPCLGPGSEAWTSDDRDEQQIAADRCCGCPALALCGRYADPAGEQVGTWGGETRTHLHRATPTQRHVGTEIVGERVCVISLEVEQETPGQTGKRNLP
ncbi:hypothetical protein [Microbacterium sp. ZXX196]|uniref:hypothetical protein n=1 Tax=Microbacterium sp. ZXX196 TaxID=2609291 RepID=UPI0012B86171|nr:hypothetical protein [Microbacterium sp. ZXX196]MTE22662.1 hypothetical protein [Microbacterium sp. ZXX196]